VRIPTHAEVLRAGLSRPGLSAPSDVVSASPFAVLASWGEPSAGGRNPDPRVMPVPGEGVLGTRRLRLQVRDRTLSWVLRRVRCGEGAMQTPPRWDEGCASTALSRRSCRGGRPTLRNDSVQSRGQNRTWESDRPGSWGALRNVTTWEPGVRPGANATEQPRDRAVVRVLGQSL
jgi:hypothetical protein